MQVLLDSRQILLPIADLSSEALAKEDFGLFGITEDGGHGGRMMGRGVRSEE